MNLDQNEIHELENITKNIENNRRTSMNLENSIVPSIVKNNLPLPTILESPSQSVVSDSLVISDTPEGAIIPVNNTKPTTFVETVKPITSQIISDKPKVSKSEIVIDTSFKNTNFFNVAGVKIPKTTIYLTIVLIVVGSGIWYATRSSSSDKKRRRKHQSDDDSE
jgi:hypothetical protein